jgi:hypothetical protein
MGNLRQENEQKKTLLLVFLALTPKEENALPNQNHSVSISRQGT